VNSGLCSVMVWKEGYRELPISRLFHLVINILSNVRGVLPQAVPDWVKRGQSVACGLVLLLGTFYLFITMSSWA